MLQALGNPLGYVVPKPGREKLVGSSVHQCDGLLLEHLLGWCVLSLVFLPPPPLDLDPSDRSLCTFYKRRRATCHNTPSSQQERLLIFHISTSIRGSAHCKSHGAQQLNDLKQQ